MYLGKLDWNSRLILVLLVWATISQMSFFLSGNAKSAVYNFYTFADLAIWALLFYVNSKRIEVRVPILLFTIAFIGYALYLYQGLSFTDRFVNELACISSLIQVFFVLAFFYSLYYNQLNIQLERKPIFWFSLGLLAYAPVTYFLLVFYNEVRGKDEYSDLWIIHNIMNTGMYVIFAIGMYHNHYYPHKTQT